MSARKLFNRCRSTAQTLISTSLVIASSAMADVVGEVQWIRDDVNGIDNLRCTQELVTSPDQRFTYTLGGCDDAINIFSRDSASGQLNFIADIVFNEETGEGIRADDMLVMSPDGKYIYVAGITGLPANDELPYGEAVYVYERDQETGLLTHVHSYRGRGLTVISNAYMSKDSKYLYIFDNQTSSIVVFLRSANGFITEHQYINGLSPTGRTYTMPDVAFSSDEKYVYISTSISGSSGLITYSRDAETGKLHYVSEITSDDDSMPGLGWSDSLALSNDGKHLYAFVEYRSGDEKIWHFNVDGAGQLSYGGQYAAPDHQVVSKFYCAGGFTLSQNDRLLYFIDDCSNNLQVWGADEIDGSLTFLGAQKDKVTNRDIFMQIEAIKIAQDQRYMYIEHNYGVAVLDLAADTHLDLTAPSAVLPGSEFQVELEVANLGAASAHGIRTEMELPTGVELVSAQPFGNATECAQEGQAVVCRIPGLDNGEAEEITVTLRADSETSAVELEASMSQYQVDPDMSNSRNSVRIARSDSADDSDEDSDSESDSGNTDGTDNNDGEADSSDSDSSGGGGSTGVGFLLMMAAAVLMRRSRKLSH